MQSVLQCGSCSVLPVSCLRGWSWWAAPCAGLSPGVTPGWAVRFCSSGSCLERGLSACEAAWVLQGHSGRVSCDSGAPQAGSGVLGQCGGCFGGSPMVGWRQAPVSLGRFLGTPVAWAGLQQPKGWLRLALGVSLAA